jgi:hypothetical protein
MQHRYEFFQESQKVAFKSSQEEGLRGGVTPVPVDKFRGCDVRTGYA